jgi:hypothetical protein
MKIKLSLIAILLGFFLVTNTAMAKSGKKPRPTQAPEISVETGGSAIALLAGILLLVGERYRSRRV